MEETTQPAPVGLTRIVIEGYKSIRHCDLELRPLNILIGANGAGKSNFIGAFEIWATFVENRIMEYAKMNGGANKLLHFGSKETQVLSLSFFCPEFWIKLNFRPDVEDNLIWIDTESQGIEHIKEQLKLINSSKINDNANFVAFLLLIGSSRNSERMAILSRFAQFSTASLWQQYHFHDTGSSSPFKIKQQLNDNLRLAADGRNLAAFLYLLQEKHPAAYRQIRDTVRLVAPFFDDFILRPDPFNENYIQLEWRERGRPDFPFMAHQLSDGTLRFIGLVTALLQPPELRPPVILIDEPELGLHPYALSVLADLMRATSATTQLIVSTQSVELLNEFEPEDVIVVDRENGESKLRRLGVDELTGWLEDYTLGELWKKNIFGGRPAR